MWPVLLNYLKFCRYKNFYGSPRDIVANVLNCSSGLIEFNRRSQYYIHYWPNTPDKGFASPETHSYGLNSITGILQKEWFSHEVDMPLNKENKLNETRNPNQRDENESKN